MLMLANRLIDALVIEFGRLMPGIADSGTDGSAAQGIAHALHLLQARETGGRGALSAQFSRLSEILDATAGLLGGDPAGGIEAVRDLIGRSARPQSLADLEALWREALAAMQGLIVAANRRDLNGATRAELTRLLVTWEAPDLTGQIPPRTDAGAADSTEITIDRLNAYLRDRFDEPGLTVTRIQPLAGGFGKQTTIFAVEGRALSGEYVIRRDIGDDVGMRNDCHRIDEEYPVIRAVFEHGFPAPDALWLDTEHRLLPGSSFIVMQRSPGRLGGNIFGAQTAIPGDLADVLAESLARLHGLPPLRELGDLTDAIRVELWDMPLGACVRRYISNFYATYLAEEHSPSPSIAALYGWLLSNVPERPGLPSLLHGDVGFHNMLFHEGRMSVLVDWEFAHVGDPAEDLGYVRMTIGHSLDWDRFMTRYVEAGGRPVDARTLHFFQVWGLVRNATGANIAARRLDTGRANDLKLAVLPYMHFPNFITGAQALIAAGV